MKYCNVSTYQHAHSLCFYLELSLWGSSNDNHSFSNIWVLSWGDLIGKQSSQKLQICCGHSESAEFRRSSDCRPDATLFSVKHKKKTQWRFNWCLWIFSQPHWSRWPVVAADKPTLIEAPAKCASCLMCWPFLPIRAPTAWVGIKRYTTSCSWACQETNHEENIFHYTLNLYY